MPATSLLNVENLSVHFARRRQRTLKRLFAKAETQTIKAVDDISFVLQRGQTLALVGESGCGKSTTGRAILQLIRPTRGRVFFQNQDLAQMSEAELRPLRRRFQMIFQDPLAALNPSMRVGAIVAEPITTFGLAQGKAIAERVNELLEKVGLNPNQSRSYPREFSGGQRQRICLARALAAEPDFIVADEPIAALDVSIQAQVMNLLKRLQREFGLAYLFISHDLRAVRFMADRVAVMYLGKLVEAAATKTLYSRPQHPYTQALLSAIPVPNPKLERARQFVQLKGELPSLLNPPKGCRFNTRCPQAEARCFDEEPQLRETAPQHFVACHFVKDEGRDEG